MPETSLFRETGAKRNNESGEQDFRELGKTPGELRELSEETSEEVSESAYNSTVEQITSMHKEIIPEEQLVRIDCERETSKPVVLSSEEYAKQFPESDPSVLGHYDSEGRVFVKDGSQEVVTHVTTHEALHLTSYKELDDADPNREVYRSGIHEVVFDECGIVEDRNQALNEGITELYAIQEMERRGETASIEAVTAYSESRQKAFELQSIVGNDVIEQAYFGGNRELLESEVNRMSYDDETAWERYSENIDILEYGTDSDEIQKARRALTIQNAVMLSFREMEVWTGLNGEPQ